MAPRRDDPVVVAGHVLLDQCGPGAASHPGHQLIEASADFCSATVDSVAE